MINAYQKECSIMRVKPVIKRLEQLEVRTTYMMFAIPTTPHSVKLIVTLYMRARDVVVQSAELTLMWSIVGPCSPSNTELESQKTTHC